MGRRRYRRTYRRQRNAYTWQSWKFNKSYTVDADSTDHHIVATLNPGVGEPGSERLFDAPHVLERIRGQLVHAGSGAGSTILYASLGITVMPIDAIQALNNAADADKPDIEDNTKGDDYLFYDSALCGSPVSVNTRQVDNKARRRVDVGHGLILLAKLENLHSSQNGAVGVAGNFRLLWKLG